jgi:signal transduction histidine kinase
MQNMMEWQVARHTVAALAHEINQPLASVSVLCEAASRMLASEGRLPATTGERPKQLEQTLQRMASETERAGAVVRQLMKSVHRPDIALAPVMLCELLHAVARMFLDENAFDCRIDIDCSPTIRTVPANRLQLTKVLMNLIGNSAQAMKNAQIVKGKISIGAALAADGATVVVSVRDTGPGISARMQQEIFQPFVTTKSDGLGMGLTISRTLIELHGGTLRCESQAPAGALFRFTLPVSKATL